MKKILFGLILFVTFFLLLPSNAQSKKDYKNNQNDYTYIASDSTAAQWVKSYRRSGTYNNDKANSIQQTYDGGYIVAGSAYSFCSGSSDFWILKLSTVGEIEWQKTYGGSGTYNHVEANSIQQTYDGGYIVAGHIHVGNVFKVLKLTPEGDVEWQCTYGGGQVDSASATSIQQTYDGGYIIAGYADSFGSGSSDFWILKLSTVGEIEWQKTYGGSGDDKANSIQQTYDGGYIVAGYTNSFGSGSSDFWILKLSPLGDVEWQCTYGGSDDDIANSIQQTYDGGYIVAGDSSSFIDQSSDFWNVWVLKVSSGGDIEWQKTVGGNKNEGAASVQQTIDGGYIIAGSDSNDSSYLKDIWVFKLSSNGEIKWQKTCGGGLQDYIHSIKQTDDGGYIVAGETSSFGTGDHEIWVFKFSSNGKLDPSCDLKRSRDATISNTNVIPEHTKIIPQDTNIKPHKTDISPINTNATVCDFCSGKYILSIKPPNYGGTTDPSAGTYTYDPGTKVTITAIPDSSYKLNTWWGDYHGAVNPITITMNSHKSIQPRFTGSGPGFWGGVLKNMGPCFIATACFGTPLAEEVKTLCAFRDQYLLTNPMGRALVKVYYRYSPKAAEFLKEKESLKAVVRECLKPVIRIMSRMVK